MANERALNLRGLQGYAGHCAHVMGWASRHKASLKWMRRLMKTRDLFDKHGLPVEIVSGGSSGTFDIDVELPGLTELQAGSYCVMDLDYRRIGAKGSKLNSQFELALTVLTTVVSRPSAELAIVDGGFKAFSTDRPFPPEAVEWPGVEYSWAGDEHGRLTISDQDRAPRLGDRIVTRDASRLDAATTAAIANRSARRFTSVPRAGTGDAASSWTGTRPGRPGRPPDRSARSRPAARCRPS